jgi:hypothetical protein
MIYAASLVRSVDGAGNHFLDAAILDCLRHGAYRPIFDGDSYRSPRPLSDEPKTTLAKYLKCARS